jgi:CRP/FNR family transcriptional regulator
MNENCSTCTLKKDGFFCQATSSALTDLDAIASPAVYPAGAFLFLERQTPRGVYVLCQGEVKLTISSSEGKRLILRIAKPGEILGLSATLSGNPYEATAETLHPCQATFVLRDHFLRFIAQHAEAYQNMVTQLTAECHSTHEQLRTVGLSASAPERLAKLLLDWSADGQQTNSGTRIRMSLTHEEIAECIGVTRETVTRTLTEFKNKHLVTLQGSSWMIPSRAALASFVRA